ncbi:hypothetical protein N824_10990 [Pedobacter sp. V48]|nr:hypothetical protein N824_10990 [Pedobacter sp. V48]
MAVATHGLWIMLDMELLLDHLVNNNQNHKT